MKERNPESESQKESLPNKEILVPFFGGLTVSGKSGTGKTSAMEILGDLYRIHPKRMFKGGETMREKTDVYARRAKKHDIDIDQSQREFIRSADPQNPFIDEGRLAGFLATQELDKNPNLNVVRILFVASSAVRMNRLFNRRRSHNAKDINRLESELEIAYVNNAEPEEVIFLQETLQDLKSKTFTLNSIRGEEVKRETDDMAQWKRIHPELQDIDDIFNPSFARVVINPAEINVFNKKGIKFYDFAVNTSRISVEEAAIEVNLQLKRMELVEVLKVPDRLPQNELNPEA